MEKENSNLAFKTFRKERVTTFSILLPVGGPNAGSGPGGSTGAGGPEMQKDPGGPNVLGPGPATVVGAPPPPQPGQPPSRSPPPQRHVHTHHHTHVGLGYPMFQSPYGGNINNFKLNNTKYRM